MAPVKDIGMKREVRFLLMTWTFAARRKEGADKTSLTDQPLKSVD